MLDESLQNIASQFEEDFPIPSEEDGITIFHFNLPILNLFILGKNGPSTSSDKSTEAPTASKISTKTHCLLVSPKQRGNPLLKSISKVPWEYEDIIPDYQMGKTTCALFLSLKYHNLNPDYIHDRLKLLGKMYELRVLLVQVKFFNFCFPFDFIF